MRVGESRPPAPANVDAAGRLVPVWRAAAADRDAVSTAAERFARRFERPGDEREEREADRREGERELRPDNPGGLLRERWQMMTSGDTTVTAQALLDARDQLVQMEAAAKRTGAFGALDAGLGDWEWMGPDNVGGRARAIVFDPSNSNHLWAGTATGGIFTSFDGGFTWSAINDFLPSLSIGSLAIDPSTNYLYAGTGEFTEAGSSTGGGHLGAGIFRSTDGGSTWTQLTSTAQITQVSRLAVVPADGFIFAATDSGLYRSSNSGVSWSRIQTIKNLRDVKATPTTHLVLVGTRFGAIRSTDSGGTWATLTTGSPGALPAPPVLPSGAIGTMRVEFTIAPDQSTCYASIDRNGGEVWRSTDAGATWTLRRSGDNYLGAQGWYDNAIWVDPTNVNVVVVGGIDAWRSTDGGASFARISDWASYPGSSAHADHHIILNHPGYNGTTNRIVYFGNDGGVQRKDDILNGSGGWTDLSNGLRSSQFYKGAIQAGTNQLLGGLQDNGSWRRQGSNAWTFWEIGDGGYCAFDADGSQAYWEYINLRMFKVGFLGFHVTCIGGLTDANDGCNSQFIAPFKADPVVPGRLFAGGSSIWRSTNFADSWTSVRGPINVVANPPNSACPTRQPNCTAIELVGTSPALVWIGYTDGTVSRSTDNGATWTNMSGLPGRFVTDIAVNPSNTNEVWVTFGGFAAGNVWFTSDGGSTWSNRSGSGSTGLPAAPVETITIHPSNRAWIYAGTSLGVLASQDRGLTWGLMRRYASSEGPAYTQVSDLMWEGNRLVAFTYGRGVYRSGPIAGTSSGPPFALLGSSLPGANSGSCDWGDYDGDGDLDVLWTGNAAASDTLTANPITRIARNDGAGVFTAINPGLPGVTDGAARWGDMDNDGDLDVAIAGMGAGGTPVAAIWRNNGFGGFTNTFASLVAVSGADVAWGDFDNDGDQDLVVSGLTAPNVTNTGSTIVYRNDGGFFTNAGAGLINVQHSSVAWGDYDNDGDLDLLLAGWLGSSASPVTLLYRNSGGVLTNVSSGLPPVEFSARWGDYDRDGDLDMLLSGSGGLSVHRNNGNGTFTTAVTLAAQLDGDAAWGDFDNDGDLDIACTGKDGVSHVTRLWRNDAGTFVDTGARLNGASRSSVAWADFDNDGDVDLFLNGWANVANAAQVYRNDATTTNTAPWSPTGLSVTTSGCGAAGTQVTFNWGASQFDDHTPTTAMGYNLRVGTTPGSGNVFSGAADIPSGFHRLPGAGNAQLRRSWTLTLPVGVYYWGVQSVDASGKTSPFTGETTTIVSSNYSDIGAGLLQTRGAASWGDYDGDDDLDLLVTGISGSNVYRNDNGTFTAIAAGLPALDYSASAWGDYDGDGDLDIALSGCLSGTYTSRIYRNDGGSFTDIGAGLPGVCAGGIAWSDWDRDGDLDLALTGETGGGVIARIYLNDAGTFWDIGAPLAGANLGNIAWGDYDSDGDPDLMITGRDDALVRHTDLYRNEGGGAFTPVYTGLPQVSFASVSWADYDRDGDVDLVLAGSTGLGADQIAKVYRNDGGGTFTDIFAFLQGVQEGSTNWGDVNGDGWLDLLVTGYNPSVGLTAKLYLSNTTGGFVAAAGTGLPGVYQGVCDLGDFDNDGDMDAVLAGRSPGDMVKIYRSCGAAPNAAPGAPAGLSAVRSGGAITLSWTAASDDHAAAGAGLTYNVRVGTTPGGSQVLSALANPASGFRRVPRPGNADGRLMWTLNVPDQRLYWSVQAVDAAYRGGPFAAEQSLGIALVQNPSALPGLYRSAITWGDYDNDGDLDLLMCGTDGIGPKTRLYRNDAGTFVDVAAGLANVEWGCVDWGDYDRDGDLDIALCGWNAGPLVSKVYRNDGGTFVDVNAALPGVIYGTVAWADYDRDGDLDLLVAGDTGGGVRMAKMYRNEGGAFFEKDVLVGVSFSYADWGDYDNDGDPDLALMGHDGSGGLTKLYRNDRGRLRDSGLSLPGAWEGALAWGDYDANGWLDLLIAGWDGTQRFTKVLRNADNLLTDIGAPLEGLSSSRVAWGDYDDDGDLDIVASGYFGAGGRTTVYRNDGGGLFQDALFNLPGTYYSSVAWGDYDQDHDLDLALTGIGGVGRVYRNDGAPANAPPSVPTNLTSTLSGSLLTLSWSPSTDDHTPTAGLTYNVRVGSTPGGGDIVPAMAVSATGLRKVADMGNAQLRVSVPFTLQQTSAYWSVQAVDGAFVGSEFAPEIPTVVGSEAAALPVHDALGPATPNPMLASTNVSLALARTGPVQVDVYGITGQHVATLFRGTMTAGRRTLRWEPRGENGAPLAAGVYLMRMKTGAEEKALKVVVMK